MTIDQMLSEARARLRRVTPKEAYEIAQSGGLLVDIRPERQRVREGEIPDALIIERNFLEWRFDLQANSHIEQVKSYDQPVVVVCWQGYTSSLAAAALQDLGFVNATDLEGGVQAWQEAGLPTRQGGTPAIP